MRGPPKKDVKKLCQANHGGKIAFFSRLAGRPPPFRYSGIGGCCHTREVEEFEKDNLKLIEIDVLERSLNSAGVFFSGVGHPSLYNQCTTGILAMGGLFGIRVVTNLKGVTSKTIPLRKNAMPVKLKTKNRILGPKDVARVQISLENGQTVLHTAKLLECDRTVIYRIKNGLRSTENARNRSNSTKKKRALGSSFAGIGFSSSPNRCVVSFGRGK